MQWMTKHMDTVAILTSVIGCCLWMNTRFNDMDREISSLRTDMAVMKTVLIMKEIMPRELAAKE